MIDVQLYRNYYKVVFVYVKRFYAFSSDCVEDIDAQRVFGYALFKDGKATRLSYPLEKFHSDVSGRSFHNGRFIQRMREKASSLPKFVPLSCWPFFILPFNVERKNKLIFCCVCDYVLLDEARIWRFCVCFHADSVFTNAVEEWVLWGLVFGLQGIFIFCGGEGVVGCCLRHSEASACRASFYIKRLNKCY